MMTIEYLDERLRDVKPAGVTLDADGVLHRGRNALPGAADLLRGLDARGIPWQIVTNNSRQTAQRAAAHFRAIGLPVGDANVLTAADAMAAFIARDHAGTHGRSGQPLVYPVGDRDQRDCLIAGGCRLTDDEDRAEYVAVGVNRQLTFQRLFHACNAIRRGAQFVVANMDATVPTETGAIPGAGALAAAIRVATGRDPFNIGKPAPELMIQALRKMGCVADLSIHVGDRIDSDVPAARQANMWAVLVTTGDFDRASGVAATGDARPHLIAPDLPTLNGWLLR